MNHEEHNEIKNFVSLVVHRVLSAPLCREEASTRCLERRRFRNLAYKVASCGYNYQKLQYVRCQKAPLVVLVLTLS